MGIVLLRDLSNFKILLMLLLKSTEKLFVANCWGANSIWSASLVAGVFSQRNCGWLVESAFFCNPDEVPGSSRGSFLQLLSPCDESLPALKHLDYQTDRYRTQLWDRDCLKTIPSGFPVFWFIFPGCSRNSYGTGPNLWVQKKFSKLRQGTKNAGLRAAEIFWILFWLLSLRSLQKSGRCIPEPFL